MQLLGGLLVSSLLVAGGANARVNPKHVARANLTTRSLPDGWSNKGCVSDSSTRLLSHHQSTSSGQTVLGCISACQQGGYTSAGLENGDECWCGKSLNTKAAGRSLDASKCNTACTGWGSSKCGGQWALNLYSTSKPASKPSGGSSSSGKHPMSPGGKKAGMSGTASYEYFKDHISWYYDWTANPRQMGKPIPIPMLWGGGTTGGQDSDRLNTFKKIKNSNNPPPFVLGFEEPDCSPGSGSSGISYSYGASLWNQYVGPLKAKGTLLGSPSMCHQAAEQYSPWLGPFQKKIKVDWDFTAVHINKIDRAGVEADLDHYWNTYGKPMMVSEFACVDDKNGFTPCTDQGEIDNFINMIVPLLENDSRVFAYAYSDGEGLGNMWPSMRGGKLSESGRTYLNAIQRYS